MKAYTWEELRVGVAEELEVVVDDAMVRAFLSTTGDENPLHVDDGYARARGFERRVVYGMLTASFCSTLVGMCLPGRDALLQGIALEFAKPVYAGDRLRVRGVVARRTEAFRRVEITCSITRDDVVVARGSVRAGVLRLEEDARCSREPAASHA